jgi:hypothetical protein
LFLREFEVHATFALFVKGERLFARRKKHFLVPAKKQGVGRGENFFSLFWCSPSLGFFLSFCFGERGEKIRRFDIFFSLCFCPQKEMK